MEHGETHANDLRFSYLAEWPAGSGPEDAGAPLALCLHGFPDTAHTWRHLLPELAGAGYRAVAPFLRGYAPSDLAPDGNYQIGALVRDVAGLHRALGGDGAAVLIGHDWGAMAAYASANHEPQRWRRMVTAAVPPTQALASSFFGYDQLRRSWYTFLFQTPLAEIALAVDGHAFIDRLWADWSPGYDAAADAARVKESIGSPERMLAAITYYRALYDPSRHDPALQAEQDAARGEVPVPTLYLHGADDACMALEAIDDPLPYLAQGSAMEVLDGAGHFLHLEQPQAVARLVLDFLAR